MTTRTTTIIAAAAAVAALNLIGCVASIPTKAYDSPLLRIPAHKPALMSAVRENIRVERWELVSVDAREGIIVALTPAEHGAGVSTRERWTFHVGDGEVTVEMKLEMGYGGVWKSGRVVCEGYEYVRERALLATLWTRVMPHEAPPPMPEPRLAMVK